MSQSELPQGKTYADYANHWDRPCAAEGLTSYRCRGRYGWIMIGARSSEEAMCEAARSTDKPERSSLQVWDGAKYVSV
jgi:hypothetical protein